MPDKDHLEILRQGVDAWNKWRRDDPELVPDLSEADLSQSALSGFDLRRVSLRRAYLNRLDLSRAYLSWSDLRGADLGGADLRGAFLNGVALGGADLNGANLSGADLSGAELGEATLSGADLSQTRCEQADFRGADLRLTRLLSAILDRATLTGARLWETQRAGWSIKEVDCKYVYWDREGKELTTFDTGEFERMYSDKLRVRVKYPEGISQEEFATLPALIQHLESLHPGCKLQVESFNYAPGGTVVNARKSSLLLKGKVLALEETVDKFLSFSSMPYQETICHDDMSTFIDPVTGYQSCGTPTPGAACYQNCNNGPCIVDIVPGGRCSNPTPTPTPTLSCTPTEPQPNPCCQPKFIQPDPNLSGFCLRPQRARAPDQIVVDGRGLRRRLARARP